MARRGRPATGETPKRTVRVPDAVWDEARRKAKAEGKNVSDVIDGCLRRYIARKGKK